MSASSYPEFDPVELAMRLMAIDSTSGKEGEVIAFVASLLSARGWKVNLVPVSDGRDNILAWSGDDASVTLSTHLDTVPPFIPPSMGDGVLKGRGACDAKGIAAAMICAAERRRAAGHSVALLFVVGEEVTHDGATAANKLPNSSRVLINGEPTESKLAVGTKGALRFTITTHGVPAHSAYPELGQSATLDLCRLLVELEGVALPVDEVLGATTINVGGLSGGVADNVVAPLAEARLMARLVGSAGELEAVLRRWLGDRASIEFGVTVPPVKLGVVPGFDTDVVAFATDIPALTNWGRPYLFGPGSIHVAHRDDEFIAVDELRNAVSAYERLASLALARG